MSPVERLSQRLIKRSVLKIISKSGLRHSKVKPLRLEVRVGAEALVVEVTGLVPCESVGDQKYKHEHAQQVRPHVHGLVVDHK